MLLEAQLFSIFFRVVSLNPKMCVWFMHILLRLNKRYKLFSLSLPTLNQTNVSCLFRRKQRFINKVPLILTTFSYFVKGYKNSFFVQEFFFLSKKKRKNVSTPHTYLTYYPQC